MMPIRKKTIYLIIHKGEVIGRTATKKSAKRICKTFFPKNCSYKIAKVI